MRRQYVEALDLLLRHDYWTDAAYVAERVLTPDELLAYVDKNWPAKLAEKLKADEGHPSGSGGWPAFPPWMGDGVSPEVHAAGVVPAEIDRHQQAATAHDIRHLLARRLVRLGRWKEARPYFTVDLQGKLDAYVQGIRDGADAKLPAAKRAAALWAAARLARYSGMDLLGTELDPDGAICQGAYGDKLKGHQMESERLGTGLGEAGPPAPDKSKAATIAPPSAEERRRFASSGVDPDKRFHYRYVAADHAWAAMQLMPDDSDELARLCTEAGGWLKGRDPDAADRFYKALVTRCASTDLGKQAAALRWFPATPAEKP